MQCRTVPFLALAALMISLLAVSGALRQAAAAAPVTAAEDQSVDRRMKEMQRRLDERDVLIHELLKRVALLEARELAQRNSSGKEQPRGGLGGTGGAEPPVTSHPAGTAASGAAGHAPRAEDAVERALERTLVRQGSLVLPPFAIEIEPAFRYGFASNRGLEVGDGLLVDRHVRQDRIDASLGVRLGLPWRSQLGVTVPYVNDRAQVTHAGFATETAKADGLGDLGIALSKQLTSEGVVRPDLVATVGYRASTGKRVGAVGGGLAPAMGSDTIEGALNWVKRNDPL
ncbi:MAG: hypothetical protein AB7P12_19345, partial [Alphaproteobacteria bacterium]